MVAVSTALLVLATRLSSSEHPAGAPKQVFPRPAWDLKYRSGSLQLKKEQWLKASFVRNGASEIQTHPIVVISRDQVRAIYINSKALKESDVAQRMPRSGCYQDRSLMPKDDSASGPDVFLAWVASPGLISRTAGRLNARYPVRIVWSENDSEKELAFAVSYCEYASFVANLRWFAGQRWQEIGREFPARGTSIAF